MLTWVLDLFFLKNNWWIALSHYSAVLFAMLEPAELQLRWQWLLVADEEWWVRAAGGKLSVMPKVGFNPTVCEAVYLKYMDRVPGLSRDVLWLVLSYFKRCPRQGAFDDISAKASEVRR